LSAPLLKQNIINLASGEKGIFTGGLHLSPDPNLVRDNESPDLWNIDFTKENIILPRKGTIKKSDLTFTPKYGYTFVNTSGASYVVLSDYEYHYLSSDLVNWTKINDGHANQNSVITRFAFINGKIYGTNGIDNVWSYDVENNTYAEETDIPKGIYPIVHNNRLFMVSTYANPLAVYYSRLDDETEFTHPITGVTNVFYLDQSISQRITGAISLQNKLYIGTEKAIYVFSGWDEQDFYLTNLTKEIGFGSHESIREFNGKIIFLATDSNFYEIDGTNIYPVGDNILYGIKNSIGQINAFIEKTLRIGINGDDSWENMKYASNDFVYKTKNSDLNGEISYPIGSMIKIQGSSGQICKNGAFTSNWDYMSKNDNWSSDNDIGNRGVEWEIHSNAARGNTQYTPNSWKTFIDKVAIEIVDGNNDNQIGEIKCSGNVGVFISGNIIGYTFQNNQTFYINNYYDNGYPTTKNGIWEPNDLKYRRIKLRVRVYRKKWLKGYDTIYIGDAGTTTIETDPFFCNPFGNIIVAVRIQSLDGDGYYLAHQYFFINNFGWVIANASDNIAIYETKEINLGKVTRFGTLLCDYTKNITGSEIKFYYKVKIGNGGWSDYIEIQNGGIINEGAGGDGTEDVYIQIKVRDAYSSGDGSYEIDIFNTLIIKYYYSMIKLPPVYENITSIVKDGKYYISMAVDKMNINSNYNNVVFVLDEYNGFPRWSRWDVLVTWFFDFGNQINFVKNQKIFEFDELSIYEKYNLTDWEYVNSKKPFYYSTKSFDFNLFGILKWFKYILFDLKFVYNAYSRSGRDNLYHIEVYTDKKYAGTYLNYDYLSGVYIKRDDFKGLRCGQLHYFTEPLFYQNPGDFVLFYKEDEDYYTTHKKIIGYGDKIALKFIFSGLSQNYFQIFNYTIKNVGLYIETKDYAQMPVEDSRKPAISITNINDRRE